jgi:hypothetical protein
MERAAAAVTMFWCVPKRCTTPHETSAGVARGQYVTRTFLVIRVIFRAVQRTPFSLKLPTLHAQDSDSGLMTRLAGPTIANSPPGPPTRRELDSDLLLSSLKTLIERHCACFCPSAGLPVPWFTISIGLGMESEKHRIANALFGRYGFNLDRCIWTVTGRSSVGLLCKLCGL